ncbi:MAG TPA: shikimate kinase [Longimicrobium sp.]|nr:shikimate kinase [Longimicrobium sp.]
MTLQPDDRRDCMIHRVVLLGFMAAGKTAVGAELARRLGWRQVDLDAWIEAREGKRVARIFAEDGEARFRALEAEATREVAGMTGVVLSPGGGWITRPENLEALGAGTLSVWLQVSPEEAVRRAGEAPGERPLLAGPDPLAAARRLLGERTPLYARAALRVDTEGRPPEAVAAIIEAEVRARNGPA